VQSLLLEISAAARELRRDGRAVLRYLLSTESHVYAFSIAANVLLAFWPFLLVMLFIFRHLVRWPAAENAIYVGVKDYFPGNVGEFLVYNLGVAAAYSRTLEWVSLGLLLFTANGVFLPLEVALNRAWGVQENRSLLKNQAISMGLIFACGGLALLSAAFTGVNLQLWSRLAGSNELLFDLIIRGFFKIAAFPITVLMLFLVYWLLPNTRVPWRLLLPRAVIVAAVLELLKWVNLAIWPWLWAKFSREFGVFKNSVTILTWSFLAGLVVLAGAEWSARRARWEAEQAEAQTPRDQDRMGAETSVSSGPPV
jgi:uncharacterized BrkB/YihY/UPF0761 family membrane protein